MASVHETFQALQMCMLLVQQSAGINASAAALTITVTNNHACLNQYHYWCYKHHQMHYSHQHHCQLLWHYYYLKMPQRYSHGEIGIHSTINHQIW